MVINATSNSQGRSIGFASSVSYNFGLFFGLPFTLFGSKTWNSSLSDDIVLVCFLLSTSCTCLANLSYGQIVHLCRQVKYASARRFRCGTGFLKFPVASLGTSYL